MEDDLVLEFRRLVHEADSRIRAAEAEQAQRRERAKAKRDRKARQDAERAQLLVDEAKVALAELKQLLRDVRAGNARVLLNGRIAVGGEISVRVANNPNYEQVIQICSPAGLAHLGITFCPDRRFVSLHAFREYVRSEFLPTLAREFAESAAKKRKEELAKVPTMTWAELRRLTSGRE